jgi:hypothetical protein
MYASQEVDIQDVEQPAKRSPEISLAIIENENIR